MTSEKFQPSFNNLTDKEAELLRESLVYVEKFIERSPKISKIPYHTRDAHAKTYAVLEGTLQMKDGLPFEVVRIFKEKSYAVTARISNANLHIPRGSDFPAYGVALKIQEVNGSEVNYPLANFAVFPTNSVSDFLRLFNRLNRFYIAASKNFILGLFRMPPLALAFIPMMKAFLSASVWRNVIRIRKKFSDFILSHTYHSIGAYRLGEEVIKLKLVPLTSTPALRNGKPAERVDILHFLQEQEWAADLQISFCKNLRTHPVNNLMKEWPAQDFFSVGTLHFDRNSLRDIEAAETENLSFNPFENAEELQPVGKIQKLREEVYRVSVATRRKLNKKQI